MRLPPERGPCPVLLLRPLHPAYGYGLGPLCGAGGPTEGAFLWRRGSHRGLSMGPIRGASPPRGRPLPRTPSAPTPTCLRSRVGAFLWRRAPHRKGPVCGTGASLWRRPPNRGASLWRSPPQGGAYMWRRGPHKEAPAPYSFCAHSNLHRSVQFSVQEQRAVPERAQEQLAVPKRAHFQGS